MGSANLTSTELPDDGQTMSLRQGTNPIGNGMYKIINHNGLVLLA